MKPSSDKSPVPAKVRTLVHRSFDEELPASDIQKIEQALSASAEARRWYSEVAQLHADLLAQTEAVEICKRIQSEFPQNLPATLPSGEPLAASGTVRRRWKISPFSIAASLLVVGLAIGCGMGLLAATIIHVRPMFAPAPWTWDVGKDVVARIAGTHNARWQPSESPTTPPTLGVRVGQQFRLAEGQLQLAFRNGAKLLLTGPVVFEVRSENGGKLYSGQLAATTPRTLSTFHIETSGGQFNFGPGHYGVEVATDELRVASTFHAFSGIAPGAISARLITSTWQVHELTEGQACRIDSGGRVRKVALANADDYVVDLPKTNFEPFVGKTIYLGNLFDDSKSVPLAEAVRTDTYQAAGETIDLGVAAVLDGGLDVDLRLAEDGVLFNLANVGGGGPAVVGLPGNDTFRSITTFPIRTTGQDFHSGAPLPKIEEGIGMCSNELITFDLDELRKAGRLGRRAMRFVADRVGINDREDPLRQGRLLAKARFVVIVSTKDKVLSAQVDGKEFPVANRNGIFAFDLSGTELPPPLRYDGRYVSFDVPIPADGRYLTLATTMLGMEHNDHGVFSGARLELERDEASTGRVARSED